VNQLANAIRIFGIWATIIFVLLGTAHLVTFISPLLNITGGSTSIDGTTSLPDDPDTLTPQQFVSLYVSMQEYNWSEYDPADFPTWLYMPENNTTNSSVQPWGGYDWENYNPEDFPSWLDMPASLPENFTAEEFDVIDYMDPEYLAECEAILMSGSSSEDPMAFLQNLFGNDGGSFDISQFFSYLAGSDLLRAILFFMGALILFILLRTTPH